MRCPRCERDLEPGTTAWSLLCSQGHSFDANKRGYLNLVDRSRGIVGDGSAILDARAAFLERGHYSPIVAALDAVVSVAPGTHIIDSGCGTGYYLSALLARRPDAAALALDVSVDAVAAAVRATAAAGLVADVWRPLPVRDACADAVLCVFAPRNAKEFARMLRADGSLVVVTPSPTHLEELRAERRVIGIQADKLDHLDAGLAGHFVLRQREALSYAVQLTATEIDELASMGPSGHHERADVHVTATSALSTVTIAVDVSVYNKRPDAA